MADQEDQGLSQADIDAAFAAGGGEESSPPAEEASAPTFTQEDIDSALARANNGTEQPPQAETAPESSEASTGLSQADIDAALNGGSEAAAAVENATECEAAQDSPTDSDARVDAAGNPFDEVATEMAAEIEKAAREQPAPAPAAAPAPPASPPPDMSGAEPLAFNAFDESEAEAGAMAQGIGLLSDVELNVKIELGRTQKTIEEILALGAGSVVELDRLAGDPVDVYVNERLVARGEVLVLNDNLCIRVNEIISGRAAAEVA